MTRVSAPSADGEILGGRFRLGRRLGATRIGDVFEAADLERNGGAVTVERLVDPVATDEGRLARIEREARAIARLEHPHLVDVIEVVRTPGAQAFFVLPRLHGETLRHLVVEEGALPVGRAVKLALQVLDALDVLHEAGVVHLGLHPDVVVVERTARGGDSVRILDVGGTRALEHGDEAARVGHSASFLSPEQAGGAGGDARSDLYSAGALLHFAITGRALDDGADDAAPPRTVNDTAIRRLRAASLPSALVDVVGRALAIEPADRFASAEEMMAALEPFVDVRALPRTANGATARADVDEIAAAKAMLLIETKSPPRASTSLRDRRALLVGIAGVAACAITYVVAIRDRPSTGTDDPEVTRATSARHITEAPPDRSAELKRTLALALQRRDPGACLDALRDLEQSNPDEARAVRALGAACTMLAGDCTEGRARFKAAAGDRIASRAADAVELQSERMAAANCPRDQLSPAEAALALEQDLASTTDLPKRVDGAVALARAVTALAPGAHFRAECLETLGEAILDLVHRSKCDDAKRVTDALSGVETPLLQSAHDALARCK